MNKIGGFIMKLKLHLSLLITMLFSGLAVCCKIKMDRVAK